MRFSFSIDYDSKNIFLEVRCTKAHSASLLEEEKGNAMKRKFSTLRDKWLKHSFQTIGMSINNSDDDVNISFKAVLSRAGADELISHVKELVNSVKAVSRNPIQEEVSKYLELELSKLEGIEF